LTDCPEPKLTIVGVAAVDAMLAIPSCPRSFCPQHFITPLLLLMRQFDAPPDAIKLTETCGDDEPPPPPQEVSINKITTQTILSIFCI
jgi:hypothetical protein